jgi:hypothetical protein
MKGGPTMSEDLLSSASQDDSAASHGRASGAVLGKTFEELLVDLQAPDDKVRSDAAIALGSLGDQRALDPLVTALHDPHWYVRWNAAEALGKLGNQQAVEPLLSIFKETNPIDSPSRNTRIAAIKALGKLNDHRVIAPLLEALDPSDPDTYRAEVEALEQLGAGDRVPTTAVVEKHTFWNHRLLDDGAIILAFLASILVCVCLAFPWLDVNAAGQQTSSTLNFSTVQPGPQSPSGFLLATSGVQLSNGTVSWTDDTGTILETFTVSPSQTFSLPLLWLVLAAGAAMVVLSGWLFWVRRLPRKRQQFHWWLLTAAVIALAAEIYTLSNASSNLSSITITSHVVRTTATPGDTQAIFTATPDLGFWLAISATVAVCLIALMRARVQRRRR